MGSLEVRGVQDSHVSSHERSRVMVSECVMLSREVRNRELDTFEFEVKFSFGTEQDELANYMGIIEQVFSPSRRYIVDPARRIDWMVAQMFLLGTNEYPKFQVGNMHVLKKKDHRLLEDRHIPIWKNLESFEYCEATVQRVVENGDLVHGFINTVT